MERFSPLAYVRDRYPDVRVIEMDLPGRIQGCVDHEQCIIWLSAGLTEVQRRCTLAYEIGQLQQGPTPKDPCTAAAHQRAAEDWAARVLIPEDGLMAAFRFSCNLPMIAAYLHVDLPTLRARLRGLTDSEQDAVMAAVQTATAVA